MNLCSMPHSQCHLRVNSGVHGTIGITRKRSSAQQVPTGLYFLHLKSSTARIHASTLGCTYSTYPEHHQSHPLCISREHIHFLCEARALCTSLPLRHTVQSQLVSTHGVITLLYPRMSSKPPQYKIPKIPVIPKTRETSHKVSLTIVLQHAKDTRAV